MIGIIIYAIGDENLVRLLFIVGELVIIILYHDHVSRFDSCLNYSNMNKKTLQNYVKQINLRLSF